MTKKERMADGREKTDRNAFCPDGGAGTGCPADDAADGTPETTDGNNKTGRTDTSFAENAAIKAVFAAKSSGLPALADDSGLEVAALGGEPGIYSARFAKDGDYMQAMSAINTRLEGNPDRGANFTCALAVAWPDGDTELFVGKVFGTLCWPPMGEHGFGYDPFFVPDGYNESFGVLGAEIKEKISHRSRAFAQFITNCF